MVPVPALSHLDKALGQAQPLPVGQADWDKLCLSHWDNHNLSQSVCPTGTGCACPSGLSKWDKTGTDTSLPKSVLDQV